MAYDILTIGGIMRDVIFLTKEGLIIENPQNPLCQRLLSFELGAKIYVNQVHFEAGGGASNTAVGFSRLGLKTAIMGRVGQDREGEELIKGLKKEKVDTRWIQIDKKFSTGFAAILALSHRKRAHAIFAYRGSNDNLVLKINKEEVKKAKWIYLSSLSSPIWEKFLKDAFSFKTGKIKLAWNPSNVQLKAGWKSLDKYLRKTDVLILNDDEARELVLSKTRIKNLSNKNLLQHLFQMGPQISIITAGKKGAYAYNGKMYYQKPAPAKVIHATGAGDSFSAGFISSLFYCPQDIQRALKWGVTNSASVIDHVGAQKGLLNKNQIIKLSKNV
jgi:ribokinase